MNDWFGMVNRELAGGEINDGEALSILNWPDDELLLFSQGSYNILT